MMDEIIRQGRNQITIRAGNSYNITFGADFKTALKKKDDEIVRLLGVAIRAAAEITRLQLIIYDATGAFPDEDNE